MSFSAKEIFEIAVQIERNGEFFYRRACEYTSNEDVRGLLTELAEMEADHERIFNEAIDSFGPDDHEGSIIDEDAQNLSYIRSIADGHVFDMSLDAQALFTGDESADELLAMAVALEKESIVYYSALRDIVYSDRTVERLDQIIREELSHVTQLNAMREQLKDE